MSIRLRKVAAGLASGERAQTSAEFVVVVPMLLLLLFLMVEFGWLLKNYIVVTNAAREVARCATVDGCEVNGASVTAEDLMKSRIGNGGGVHPTDKDSIQFAMYYKDENGSNTFNQGDTIVVCVQAPSRSVTPLLIFAGWSGVLPNPVQIKAKEEMRVELPYTGSAFTDPEGGPCFS